MKGISQFGAESPPVLEYKDERLKLPIICEKIYSSGRDIP